MKRSLAGQVPARRRIAVSMGRVLSRGGAMAEGVGWRRGACPAPAPARTEARGACRRQRPRIGGADRPVKLPRRAASMAATSIPRMVIMASKGRRASSPLDARPMDSRKPPG